MPQAIQHFVETSGIQEMTTWNFRFGLTCPDSFETTVLSIYYYNYLLLVSVRV